MRIDRILRDADATNLSAKAFYHTNDLNNIYLIGDTLIDIKTAQNAGIHSVGVTWCITKRETFESANTEYIIDHPSELIKILEE